MNFDGAQGWLLGEPHRGLMAMFAMMNSARLGVGLQGLGLMDRAYRCALAYSKERLQMRALGGPKFPEKPADPILVHPDVRRMLLTCKALSEGSRALALHGASLLDVIERSDDDAERKQADELLSFLTPIIKACLTEWAVECTYHAQQCFGGHGYIREQGMEQLARDARITTIYEGTTGIQANDLIGRKLARESIPGSAMKTLLAAMDATATELAGVAGLATIAANLTHGIDALSTATDWVLENYNANPQAVAAGAVPFLKLAGIVVAGWLMAKSAAIAAERLAAGSSDNFYRAKLVTAEYFATHQLPFAPAHASEVTGGAPATLGLPEGLF